MKNYIAKGNTLIITAPPAGLISGQLVRAGKLIVIASGSAVEGEQVAAHITGVYLVPKDAGVAVAQGEELYFVDATGTVNKTTENNTFSGYAFEAAGAADTSIMLLLSH